MTAPAGLLLDAMGTLIGLRRSVGCLYAEVAAEHGLELDPEPLDHAFAEAYGAAAPLSFPAVSAQHLEQAERHWWQQRIEATFSAVGVQPLPIGLGSDLFDRFATPEPWGIYPEVLAALKRWRGQGLRLAVVSNFDRRLHDLLERLGLRDLLDLVLVSSEVGSAKPEPGMLLHALEQLDLRPEQAWHIGDSRADTAAAAAAGMRCLKLERASGILVP
jgi:putative hydrolase of the HAD superfamily